MAVLSVISTLAFLCPSHGKARKSAKDGENNSSKSKKNYSASSSPAQPSPSKRFVLKIQSNLSSKALLKMISWRKAHEEEERPELDNDSCSDGDGDDDEEALWRKTIMKGERCRPLDFSGKIVYDSGGNLLT